MLSKQLKEKYQFLNKSIEEFFKVNNPLEGDQLVNPAVFSDTTIFPIFGRRFRISKDRPQRGDLVLDVRGEITSGTFVRESKGIIVISNGGVTEGVREKYIFKLTRA